MIALLWLACAKPPPPGAPLPAGPDCAVGATCAYDAGLLHLASAFAAKEACSCVFVAGRSEEECAAWVKVSPAVATWRVDRDGRRVIAHALGAARTVATFDPARGCALQGER